MSGISEEEEGASTPSSSLFSKVFLVAAAWSDDTVTANSAS
jgi:hypothetical protein